MGGGHDMHIHVQNPSILMNFFFWVHVDTHMLIEKREFYLLDYDKNLVKTGKTLYLLWQFLRIMNVVIFSLK